MNTRRVQINELIQALRRLVPALHIVDLHGGKIDIRNGPEGGAEVVIMLQADKGE